MKILVTLNDDKKIIVKDVKGFEVLTPKDAAEVEMQNALTFCAPFAPDYDGALPFVLEQIKHIINIGDGDSSYLEEALALIVCTCEKQVGELDPVQVVGDKTGWGLLKRFIETSGEHDPDYEDWNALGGAAKAWLLESIHDRLKVEQ